MHLPQQQMLMFLWESHICSKGNSKSSCKLSAELQSVSAALVRAGEGPRMLLLTHDVDCRV